MRDAFICDGIRTPIGRYGGALAGVRADDLAAIPLRELLSRNPRLDASRIDDVIFGCANQAGEDNRNVAHMGDAVGGLSAPAWRAPPLTACAVRVWMPSASPRVPSKPGDADLADCRRRRVDVSRTVRDGQSHIRLPSVRPRCFDTTIGWRFVNPLMQQQFGTDSMPETAENVAELLNISREDQDAFAYRSQQRTAQAQRDGILAQEIVPVQIIGKKGAVSAVRDDEHPRAETTLEQLAALKTPFRKGGVVTAGNASGVNDGAAAMIIASEQQAHAQGLTPRARIVAMATAGVEPKYMGLGPVPAVRKVLERAGLNINDMDVI
ncbi:Beta-ketoadipyl-CoA thiolase [Kluyvera cryocrescens]|uniref:Beta-ketoadipyl-CoA thiolase n=1 Tax=Kluyvera cryocrescens TaxID=580 RepID=A0A485CSY5_KLUCR|nr:Beta-ketoadipyl-CoA thiolase [Kluyvera cryocrescens]